METPSTGNRKPAPVPVVVYSTAYLLWADPLDEFPPPPALNPGQAEDIPSLVSFMGVTGAGKSSFVKELREKYKLYKATLWYFEKLWDSSADFSSGSKQYFVTGDVNGVSVEALPDSGADRCLISPKLVSQLGLRVAPGTRSQILLPNRKPVQSPGKVDVSWSFGGEAGSHTLECWVLPGCVHHLVLGSQFLRATQTLTKFSHRIKSKLVKLPRRLQLRLLGDDKQRLWGTLNGHFTKALPDTGSDVMLVSQEYASKIGLVVDRDFANWLEVEFADGSTAWTSGVARDVPWTVGGKTIRCDFHVLDDLCVDVVLSKNYLFEMNVFTEHGDYFSGSDAEDDDLFHLCNIRLIGRYSDTLNGLEQEYLEDVTSPNAFSSEMVQRELARRDQIRDEIMGLPEGQREAANQAEMERCRRWQDLRQAHRLRWSNRSSGQLGAREGGNAHKMESPAGREDGPLELASQKSWWRRKVSVSIPLRYVRRDGGA